MAAIVWQQVVDFDASLEAVPEDAQTTILDHVNSALNLEAFDGEDGYRTRMARIFLAAHLGLGAVPGTSGAGGGAVTSESGGDGLSVTYAVSAAATTDGALSETAWGRRYREIVRSSPAARVLVVL